MMQINRLSGKAYQGKNQKTLEIMQRKYGYTSPQWLTFLQAKQLGLNVKKDSHGIPIMRLATFEKDDKIVRRPVKNACVFNLDQTEAMQKVEA